MQSAMAKMHLAIFLPIMGITYFAVMLLAFSK